MQAGGRTIEWVSGLYAAVAALGGDARGARAAGPGSSSTSRCPRSRTPPPRPRADLMDSLRGRPDSGPPGAQLRDPVDRADVRRLRRVQHQHPHAVRQLPADDRASRPHRGRVLGARSRTASRTGRSGTGSSTSGPPSTRPPRSSRWPPSCASRSRRCATAPRSPSSSRRVARGSLGRRPDRHVPRAAPAVDDRRRGGAAAPARAPAGRAHRHASSPAPPKPPATARARAAARGHQGARPHRLVGGPVGVGDARRARRRRRPRRVGHPRRRHALTGRRSARTATEWWELQRVLPHRRTPTSATSRSTSRSPRAATLALRLIEQCDVVVENFTPRVIEQFDLGWDVVHAANPRAVMVRMPAFGLDGPWRDRPGLRADHGAGHRAGLAHRSRRRPAAHPAGPVRPERRACTRWSARSSALELRDRTGVGLAGRVDDVRGRAQHLGRARSSSGPRTATLLDARGQPQPVGRAAGRVRRPTRPSGGSRSRWRPTSSGRRSSTRSGVPTWATDPALRTHAGRRARARPARRDARRVGGRRPTSTRPSTLLAAARGPRGAGGRRPRSRRQHPQFVARGYYEDARPPGDRRAGHPSLPFRFAGVDRWIRSAGADARPAQPRDPRRDARPLRRRDRRARGRPT